MARVITNPKDFRDGVVRGLEGLLDPTTSGTFAKLSKNIEKTVLNYAISEAGRREVVRKWDNNQFVEIYISRLRSIWRNMENAEFASRIINKVVSPGELAKMTHQDMSPGRWEALIQTKRDRDENKYAAKTDGNTDDYKCRCGSTKCHAYELQTRSADEPMTVFVQCLVCGKRWKC
jgi:DNA-directed RNA polymerase subunit M/transcription elongation factor TFIIS